MFYAEYCPYGLRTISDCDKVMQFVTRAERDEMVQRINAAHWDSVEGVCAPITRKEAAKSYRIQDFGREAQYYGTGCTEVRDLRHVQDPRTCAGRTVFEVTRK